MERQDDFTPAHEDDVLLHEERIGGVEKAWRGIGYVRGRKRVGSYRVNEEVPLGFEKMVMERAPVEDGDSGRIERLPDGAISIPIFEEEVVIEKRAVLKERVILRKEVVTEVERVRVDLRKEHLELEADPGVELRVDEPPTERL
jgi:uncharacterized protein (TIGR02271 family)